ncbi:MULTISPECIES: MFS transporter [Streptomyces]|uniref:MFS transporter n=1 Tax=Streptomyces TaxID=1883 RepID=UPI00163C49AE|nr:MULTISPECIES: MFS transporter [Streptomyces]MBC2876517.1 MFS transporter [Streptomyces sp. TYQ1024]UBI40810.1 MFS transporter [Streptomyces mobaraensis]
MYVFRPHDPFQRAQLAIVALFCSLGFQYATWAARIPALKTDLGLSTAEVGVLLMAAGIGAAVSFPLVALLMKRLGSRRLALLSQLALALLLPALAAAPNYPVALLVLGVDGVCVGCLNVAMNAQGAALEARFERTAMARLHATFSGGSLLAALLASGMTAVTSSVAAHFGVAAALLVLLNASARGGLLTEEQPRPEEAGEKKPTRGRWVLPSRITLWMCSAMAFGTVTEGAMNDWSTLYMKDVADASAGLAPLGIAVVSGMMVVARLFADGWRDRWGDGRVVLLGSALAAAGLAFALLSGGVAAALAGFACVGLGIAAVTPCVYAAAARQGSDSLTLVAAMGTTGLLAGPPLIGFIANASGLAWGFAAVAVAAGVVSLCSTRIRWTPVSG